MGSRREAVQNPLLNTPALNWDDNRARQNIVFETAPPGVVGGIHPLGRLRLEWVELRRPVKRTPEAVADKSAAPRGSFAEVHVVEFGVLAGLQQPVPVGGLTTRLRH